MSEVVVKPRLVRVALSPTAHRVKREHLPRPSGRSLVITTLCGIVAFEEAYVAADFCERCRIGRGP